MNILYIGQSHKINDPRLRYREMEIIKRNCPNAVFYFLQYPDVLAGQGLEGGNKGAQDACRIEEVCVGGLVVTLIRISYETSRWERYLRLFLVNYWRRLVGILSELMVGVRFDVIQASDVRELCLSRCLNRHYGCKIIYDSHEDYVRQVLDFGVDRVRAMQFALSFILAELCYIRCCDHVFCTDEYLYKKYSQCMYSANKLSLLRNFPLFDVNLKFIERGVSDKQLLKFVYIGGVNQVRGVIEAAKYIKKFNSEGMGKKITFTIYSPDNSICQNLVRECGVAHIPWIDYKRLMVELAGYDVGVCLWHPVVKFYRNIPLKNFDYMSVGLPIITSNFGNLMKYIIKAKSGVCIDPLSYEEFKQAALLMFDASKRKEMGDNGREWVRHDGNFVYESVEYVKAICAS